MIQPIDNEYINLEQDCSNSRALAMEILQSSTHPIEIILPVAIWCSCCWCMSGRRPQELASSLGLEWCSHLGGRVGYRTAPEGGWTIEGIPQGHHLPVLLCSLPHWDLEWWSENIMDKIWFFLLPGAPFINPFRAKFFRVNINMYLHSMSFLRTNETQVVEIPPWVRQGPAYTT